MAIPTQEPFQESYLNSFGYFSYGGSLAVNLPNFLYRDPADGNVKPMSNLSTANYAGYSTAWLLKRAAKKYFAGLSGFAALATDPAAAAQRLIHTDLCIITNLASATCNAGDMVAVALNGGNNACLDDTVVVTPDSALAIGRVVSDELYSSAGTKVKVRLFSNLVNFPSAYSSVETLTENVPFGSVGSITGAGPYTGTYSFANSLPAGSIILGWQANVKTAFAGASITAVTVELGYTGTATAWSQTTNGSLFAVGQIGSAAPIATQEITAAQNPLATFTLTGGNTLSAGSVDISVRYLPPLA